MKKLRELKPSQLRWQCDPKILKFKTTKDLSISEGIIGQPRAIEAIKLGINVKYPGYNIFITGPVGTGRTTAITRLLEKLEFKKGELKDLLYVNNFKNPDMPKLIELASGKGKEFKSAMLHLITNLKNNIPQVLSSEEYQKRKQNIVNKYEKKHRELLTGFEKNVEHQRFKVVQMQMGPFVRPAILPIIEDKPTKLEDVEDMVKQGKISEERHSEMKEKIQQLEGNLAALYTQAKELQDAANNEIIKLNEYIIKPVVVHIIDAIKKKFPNKKIEEYLDEVLNAIMVDLERFLKKEQTDDEFREFGVNILVDNSEIKGLPIIFETTPSYKNLFGTIEKYSGGPGLILSDFLNIRAGSFLRANGGFLVINSLDALMESGVWQTLKRTLRNGVIDIQAFDPFYIFTTSALKPEPITIDLKVVMIGPQWLYYLLYYQDEDFRKIFKVKAEFDTVMHKNADNINEYASFIKSICDAESLLHFNRNAVAEIIEYSVRVAGRQDKLSTRFHIIADMIREADYWARQAKKKEIGPDDVDKAITGWKRRLNMPEDKIQEMIEKDILMISTKGSAVGQINGLSVYQMGGYSFGRPAKITAKVSLGRAGIINLEREANLGGPIYNKGVLILSGFLKSRYAQNLPMSIDATLGFEQSYSEVDGDSASSAEIYVLLSALSDVPLSQEIAVTGSVNQNGEIQPIGGVNEKIEGFYEVCKAKGFTGRHGVVIPERNIDDLMLRQEIVDAVERKKFHIYTVETIDEGIEILTGVRAGEKTTTGWKKDSINYLVDKKLNEYADKMKGFTKGK